MVGMMKLFCRVSKTNGCNKTCVRVSGALFWLAFLVLGLATLPSVAATPALKITRITPQAGLVIVNWTNGTGPFQVQCCTSLGGPWVDIAGTTSRFSRTNLLTH